MKHSTVKKLLRKSKLGEIIFNFRHKRWPNKAIFYFFEIQYIQSLQQKDKSAYYTRRKRQAKENSIISQPKIQATNLNIQRTLELPEVESTREQSRSPVFQHCDRWRDLQRLHCRAFFKTFHNVFHIYDLLLSGVRQYELQVLWVEGEIVENSKSFHSDTLENNGSYAVDGFRSLTIVLWDHSTRSDSTVHFHVL